MTARGEGNGSVGLVLVSHSASIAEGVAELVAQVAGPERADRSRRRRRRTGRSAPTAARCCEALREAAARSGRGRPDGSRQLRAGRARGARRALAGRASSGSSSPTRRSSRARSRRASRPRPARRRGGCRGGRGGAKCRQALRRRARRAAGGRRRCTRARPGLRPRGRHVRRRHHRRGERRSAQTRRASSRCSRSARPAAPSSTLAASGDDAAEAVDRLVELVATRRELPRRRERCALTARRARRSPRRPREPRIVERTRRAGGRDAELVDAEADEERHELGLPGRLAADLDRQPALVRGLDDRARCSASTAGSAAACAVASGRSRSSPSVYWTRSFVPIERKSASAAISAARRGRLRRLDHRAELRHRIRAVRSSSARTVADLLGVARRAAAGSAARRPRPARRWRAAAPRAPPGERA